MAPLPGLAGVCNITDAAGGIWSVAWVGVAEGLNLQRRHDTLANGTFKVLNRAIKLKETWKGKKQWLAPCGREALMGFKLLALGLSVDFFTWLRWKNMNCLICNILTMLHTSSCQLWLIYQLMFYSLSHALWSLRGIGFALLTAWGPCRVEASLMFGPSAVGFCMARADRAEGVTVWRGGGRHPLCICLSTSRPLLKALWAGLFSFC